MAAAAAAGDELLVVLGCWFALPGVPAAALVSDSISILLGPNSINLSHSDMFLTRKTDRVRPYISNPFHPGTFVYLVNPTDLFITAHPHQAGHLFCNEFLAAQEQVMEHEPLQRDVVLGTDRDALSNAATEVLSCITNY